MTDVFETAARLQAEGKPFVFATVVRAESPTSARPGDKAVITADGVVTGWVGGSCAQPTVCEEALAALADGECRLLHLSPDPDLPRSREGLQFKPMTCYSGGTLEIYIEPHLAKPHLLVFGNSPVAQALVALGAVTGYLVTVIDLTDRPPLDGQARVVHDLESVPETPPGSTFAVVATHGMFDEIALEWALAAEPAYVGLVTSRRRRDAILDALAERGVSNAALERVQAPAGLDIRAATPEEVAVSILAQVIELHRSGTGARARDLHSATRAEAPSEKEAGGGCCSHRKAEAAHTREE